MKKISAIIIAVALLAGAAVSIASTQTVQLASDPTPGG